MKRSAQLLLVLGPKLMSEQDQKPLGPLGICDTINRNRADLSSAESDAVYSKSS